MFSNNLYRTFENCYQLSSEEAVERNKRMQINLKNNTFVKYRDATRRIIMISTKLP